LEDQLARILASLLCMAGAAVAQTHAFVRVAASNTPRPDGLGSFNLNVLGRPAMDGTRIVFTTVQANQSLWVYDLAGSQFLRLADTNTPAPGGTGTFTDFATLDSKPLLKDGTVVFLAYDSKTTRPNQGLYSVPVGGGPIARIANYNTSDAGGGAFMDLDASARQPFGGFSVDRGKVAFTATTANGSASIYTANVDGTALARVADRNVIFPLPPPALRGVDIWQNPWLWRDTLIFYGQTITDPSTGYNGIYTAPLSGGVIPSEWFNSLRALPGNANPTFHTRIRIPTLQIEDQTVAFVADDPGPGGAPQGGDRRFRGLYTMPRGGGALQRIADINSQLPGMATALTATSFANYSLNAGRILFRVVGGPREGFPANEQALMLWDRGVITRVIGTGDVLDGRIVRQVFDLSPLAMSGDRLTFMVDFAAFPGPGLAVYAAVPVSNTSVTGVQNSASYTANVVSPGGIVTVYGAEMGPGDLSTFELDASGRVPSVLRAARILFNGEAAPILYVSGNQSSAIVPYLLDGAATAQVVVQHQDRVSRPFPVPVRAADPGLFSLERTGTGPGAILNENGSVNTPENPAAAGSIVVLFGAGFGATNPVSLAGEITSAASPPRLRTPVTAITIGGQPSAILYQGPAPGAVAGLYQFNIRLPASVGTGNVAVKITQGSVASQEGLTVAIQ
jgi:uncharacterized protein (TIGR03437 family)